MLTLQELLPEHLTYPDVLTSYRWPVAVDCPPGTESWLMAELAACGTLIGTAPDDRRAHVALRQAYTSGTMTQKIDDLLDAIGLPSGRATLNISVIMIDRGDCDHTLAQVAPQEGVVQLVLLTDAPDAEKRARAAMPDRVDVVVRRTDPGLTIGGMLSHALDLCQGDLVAVMDAQDVYGRHYLTDLSRAFLFTTADIVGKAAFYAHLRDVTRDRAAPARGRVLLPSRGRRGHPAGPPYGPAWPRVRRRSPRAGPRC